MFCTKCGNEITTQNGFCPYCGTPVAVQPVSPTTPLANQFPVTPPPAPQFNPTAYPEESRTTYMQSPVYTPQYISAPPPVEKKSKTGLILAIVLPCAATLMILIILAASFIIKNNQKNELHSKLMRDWSRTEYENGVYYKLILDFSEDEIEYIFDSTYVDDTISTYEYEVIDGDTIEVEGFGEVDVSFNEDESMMILTPSITDTDPSGYWFNY